MHAQMTVSKPPCSQKCRQHGLTYLHRLDNLHQGFELRAGAPKDQVRPHTRFQRARKIRPSSSNSSKICGHLSRCSYLEVRPVILKLGAMVETPHTKPKPSAKRATRRETRMHAQMTVSPSPHAPKSVASTV
jgi:hypothetical protein